VTDPGLDLAGAYEQAFEAAPGSVLIADREGTIVLVNRELERRFGYSRTELVGHNVDALMPGAAALMVAAQDQGGADTLQARSTAPAHHVVARRKEGTEVAVDIGLHPVRTANGWFVVASIVEVSDSSRIDDTPRAALEEQLALERLIAELSSQFINLPAHRIDEAIWNGLRQASELLCLDRGTFVRIGPDGTLMAPVSWTTGSVAPVDTATAVSDRFPWTIARALAGEVVCFATRDEIPSEVDRASYEALGTQSGIAVPLSVDGRVTAVVGFSAVHGPRAWPPALVHRLTMIASVFAQAVARQRRDEALQTAIEEARRLKDQLQMENVYLRQEARERLGPIEIVGQSAPLRRVLTQIQQVAGTDSTVLLLGETGTGKELFAAHIHALGSRRGRAMVRVNCAAIPATLVESELFGREKGAFTGALTRQVGRFELADHSTIFLDEIGDLPLEVQVKLLRVLEERKFERLGSPRPISVDTRIIAATHRNLEQRIAEGAFREDLYYRLNVFPIQVPPLRERLEDIPLLVYRLVEEFSRAFGKRIDVIEPDTLAAMQRYSWPGNIRELRNVVERAMIVTRSRRLTVTLPETAATPTSHSPKLVDVEREHILAVLESSAWRIRGAGGAANRLGMKPTTLETRMAKLGLKRPGA
jgi:formate hydrogenlyase transcriptional activator